MVITDKRRKQKIFEFEFPGCLNTDHVTGFLGNSSSACSEKQSTFFLCHRENSASRKMEKVQVGERRLTIQKKLGNGAFGDVYQVKDQSTSEVFALKDIRCDNESALEHAVQEAQNLRKVKHENIIAIQGVDTLVDISDRSKHLLILTELCSGGSLNERLMRQSNEQLNTKWMSQIADALSYLHEERMVHRDLKPENVLLTGTEDVKLADFGLAREYTALKTADPVNGWLNFYKTYYMNTFAGTPFWMAPEVFSGRYTEKADVFSLGVVFFTILERDYVTFSGKRFYGAFVNLEGKGKVGLGYAMTTNPNAKVAFSLETQGSTTQRRITLDALSYDPKDRPSAVDVYNKIH